MSDKFTDKILNIIPENNWKLMNFPLHRIGEKVELNVEGGITISQFQELKRLFFEEIYSSVGYTINAKVKTE